MLPSILNVLQMSYLLGLLLNAESTFSSSFSRLQGQDIHTEALRLTQLEANLCIGMETEGKGRLWWHCLFNVLCHLSVTTALLSPDHLNGCVRSRKRKYWPQQNGHECIESRLSCDQLFKVDQTCDSRKLDISLHLTALLSLDRRSRVPGGWRGGGGGGCERQREL